ncbi:MAG: hypothetical protein GXP54_04600 [Deltaproteobacteria bacterium]|nr:hypothetical protein [Deltaproteobacteria bacterium]
MKPGKHARETIEKSRITHGAIRLLVDYPWIGLLLLGQVRVFLMASAPSGIGGIT